METPPRIAPLDAQVARPLISVMIPTYGPPTFLGQTLTSVLEQDWGAEMEIAVVDNCSEDTTAENIVQKLGKGRIRFYRNESNLGISGNFNRCINLAKGHWIHLLHSDDFILPGFYDEWRSLIDSRPADVVLLRCNFVDADNQACDAFRRSSDFNSEDSASVAIDESNPLPRLRADFLELKPLPCVGMIVRRSVYEELGGYLTTFGYSLDVELMSRLFFNRPTLFSNKRLSAFRLHPASTGVKLVKKTVNAEFYALAPYLRRNLKLSACEYRQYRRFCHRQILDRCKQFADAGDLRAWLHCEKIYAKNLTNPREVIDYVLRTNRMFFRFLRGRIGYPVS